MLTLAMLLAVRNLFGRAKQRVEEGDDEVPTEHVENRTDAKRPRFKVKKKNLERIYRIERRMDVWEDMEIALDPRNLTGEGKWCPVRHCASSTQTNALPTQEVASMQTESAILCSLAVQTQWVTMPTTLRKLHADRPAQCDMSLQTELVGINISVQTERIAESEYSDEKDHIERIDVSLQTECANRSVYMQTEHRVFVFQTISMQTEEVETCERAFQTKLGSVENLEGVETSMSPEILEEEASDADCLLTNNVMPTTATVLTQTDHVDKCDVGSQIQFVGKNVSMQTDTKIVVLQTGWVQTEQAAMRDNFTQSESVDEISEVSTSEFASQTDVSGNSDVAVQTESASICVEDKPSCSEFATQTHSVALCSESNQTDFASNDVSVQTDQLTLSNLVTQTDIVDSKDVALQTDELGESLNKDFTTQTEEVSKCDAAFQTIHVGTQSTEVQTETLQLPNLATQTDSTGVCDTAFQTEFLGNDVSVQTVRQQLPNLATQTDSTGVCDTAFQTEFLGNDVSIQTTRPKLPDLETQTDLIELCDTALQTEFLVNSVSVQTEKPTNPEFSSQTECVEKCNFGVQTEINARAISVQTEQMESPTMSTQTASSVTCNTCSQTELDARNISSQTERIILPTFSMQTDKALRINAGMQTNLIGKTISSQTVPQTRPTFSMQTIRVVKSDLGVQTEFDRRSVYVQTIKPTLPTFSMQTEKAVRIGCASQTELFGNNVSIQTEQDIILPFVTLESEVAEKSSGRVQSELVGTSMETKTLMLPSFSTQTDLVAKSDSALQTEVSQKSIAIQTIKVISPTFSMQTERTERHNCSSQTELVARCASLPTLLTFAAKTKKVSSAHRSCQTDFSNKKCVKEITLDGSQSADKSEWMSFCSLMDSSNGSAVREIEDFDLKRIKATYSTCTAEEHAHYLGTIAEKLLKWHEVISLNESGNSPGEDKLQAAYSALREIDQELRDCPVESGQQGILVSARDRVNFYYERLQNQKSKPCDTN